MSAKNTVTFDSALPMFAEILSDSLGQCVLDEGTFLRDVSGRLTFVLSDDRWNDAIESVGCLVSEQLHGYVDGPDHAISTPARLFDDSLRTREGAISKRIVLPATERKATIWIVDRRGVGQDWLMQPAAQSQLLPLVVFASIKGGVGRTTALCVLAAHLASSGKRVLAVDMDFEAPGLGTMLLTPETQPEFGLLDYIVESAVGGSPSKMIIDSIGPSWLGGGRGRIDVVPVVGSRSAINPENVLSKIARAYLVSGDESGGGLSGVLSSFLSEATSDLRYDVVLVDARAGLHETTASAILGLGGEVFLFGVNQPQTLLGFDFLLSHIAERTSRADAFWSRLHFVQAKSAMDDVDASYQESIENLLRTRLFATKDVQPDLEELASNFDVEWGDFASIDTGNEVSDFIDSLSFVSIPETEAYRSFDPLIFPDLLSPTKYFLPYAAFIEEVGAIIEDYKVLRTRDVP
ncbi:ParA family protein [Xanthomonas arboricola]|nr:ParA family protein [Xanthomonas arboricola]